MTNQFKGKVAGEYNQWKQHDPVVNSLYEKMARRLAEFLHSPSDAVLLEIGSGTGITTAEVLSRCSPAQIHCVDLSADMVRQAKAHLSAWGNSNITYHTADITAYLERDARTYTAAFSGFTVHNMTHAERKRLFSLLAQAISPGGIFLNADKTFTGDEGIDRTESLRKLSKIKAAYANKPHMQRYWEQHLEFDLEPERRMTRTRLNDELEAAGFSDIEIEPAKETPIYALTAASR